VEPQLESGGKGNPAPAPTSRGLEAPSWKHQESRRGTCKCKECCLVKLYISPGRREVTHSLPINPNFSCIIPAHTIHKKCIYIIIYYIILYYIILYYIILYYILLYYIILYYILYIYYIYIIYIYIYIYIYIIYISYITV